MSAHFDRPTTPLPAESGSEQAQGPPALAEIRSFTLLHEEAPSQGNHFGAAIDAIPEIRGPISMQLVAAGYRQLQADLQDTKAELRRVHEDRDHWRAQYYAECIRAEKLAVKGQEQPRRQRVQNAALAVGGVVMGSGFSLALVEASRVSGVILTVVGGVLMWFGAVRFGEDS